MSLSSTTRLQSGQHFLNGEWVTKEKLMLPTADITFLRGFGVFDFLRTYDRKPFLLRDHVNRLIASATEMGLSPPAPFDTHESVEEVVHEGIKRNPAYSDLYIKLYFTGGEAADAITIGTPSFMCMFLPAGSYPPEDYTKGIKLITMRYERYMPKAKSLNYMAAVVGVNKARKVGAHDALYLTTDGKYILEGTTQNFFAVRKGKVFTAEEGVLDGITRKHVLWLAGREGIEVDVDDLPTADIPRFDEAFITSTTREITPVIRIDQQTIGNGTVGPVTQRLMQAFKLSLSLDY